MLEQCFRSAFVTVSDPGAAPARFETNAAAIVPASISVQFMDSSGRGPRNSSDGMV